MHREVANQCFLILSFIAIVSATVQLGSVSKDLEKAPKRPAERSSERPTEQFQEQPAGWSAEPPAARLARQPAEEAGERPAAQVHPVQVHSSYKKGYIGKDYLDLTFEIGDNDVMQRESFDEYSVEDVDSEKEEEVLINQQELVDQQFEATSPSLNTALQSNLAETRIQHPKTGRDGLDSGQHVHQKNDKNLLVLKHNEKILRTLNGALEYTQLFSCSFSQVVFNTTWEVVSISSFEEDDTMLLPLLPVIPAYETPSDPFFSTPDSSSWTDWLLSKVYLVTSRFTSTSASFKLYEDVEQFCQQVEDNKCRVDKYEAALEHVVLDQALDNGKLLLLRSIDSIIKELQRASKFHYKAMKACGKTSDHECLDTILNTVYRKRNKDDMKMRGVRTTRQLLKGLRYMTSIYSKFEEPRRQ